MTLIRIEQQNQSHQARLSFANGTNYDIAITPPFDSKQESQLEWYFEGFLKYPFMRETEAKQIGDSIRDYGEKLFEQLFSQRKAYADYQAALANGLSIEIIGNAAFHALHWESLKDPDRKLPLAVEFVLTRKPIDSATQRQTIQPQISPVLRVLLVTSRPNGKNDVGYRTISQPLLESIQNSRLPVQLDLLRPATYQALIQQLENCEKGFYHILHFDVHGSVLDYASLKNGVESGQLVFDSHYGTSKLAPYENEKAFLFLDGDDNTPHAVEANDIKDLLSQHGIPLVVLNACQSAKHKAEQGSSLGSLLMQAGIQGVLAMAYSVTVSAAALYVKTLYQQLLQHNDFNAAARRARFELFNDKQRNAYFNYRIELEDWLLPVVYQQQPIQLPLREFHAEEAADWYELQARQYQAPVTEYGFVGRDLDVLEIEKCLIQNNLLLIQGMGGAGKTTLLQHLMNWWQVTHFVEQVFYFGYDERAYTRQQILRPIAMQLLSDKELAFRFQPLSESAQQAFLVQKLRATRHCLILDNLESVTGQALAIPHCLTEKEQAELKAFIHALHGGKTLLLLGSRAEESWLKLPNRAYLLNGLDPEAASQLADKILKKQNALHYRTGEHKQALQTLLKLLAGFPLALQVVLANCKNQTPKQILTALQSGDAAIDFSKRDNSQSKTESILRCIEYSYSPLSAAAQALLLCLAPFKAVLYLPLLELYSEKLKAHAVLADLPFEQWQSVLTEAQQWGLITAHEMDGFINLQPTLSYFLSHRLQQDTARQQAIQTAFRELYDICGGQLYGLMNSKQPQEKLAGQVFTKLEYENLTVALQLALTAQVSIINFYNALEDYLDSQQAQQQGLELGQTVLAALESYPAVLLQGELDYEFVCVLDDLARYYLLLKRYREAEQSYQKALSIWKTNTRFEQSVIKTRSKSICQQLGYVALEQRQFPQAHAYYQQALAITIEFNYRYGQASIYHQLGSVAQEQRQFEVAHAYYQQALAIKIEFNDRYSQICTYHQLGTVAREQREFTQAYEYYQKALALMTEFNDSHGQASTYHELGKLSQEQRQFAQAHAYYQQALAIYIEFNDRHGQARIYHQLGHFAGLHENWQQAQSYSLQSLTIYDEYQDKHSLDMVLRNIKILYHKQPDPELAGQIAAILNCSAAEALAILQQDLED